MSPYREGVESNTPVAPKFCPICGHDSIKPVTKRGVLHLFRCGEGHYFVFDPKPDEEEESNKK
jgi:hypothetical protein